MRLSYGYLLGNHYLILHTANIHNFDISMQNFVFIIYHHPSDSAISTFLFVLMNPPFYAEMFEL